MVTPLTKKVQACDVEVGTSIYISFLFSVEVIAITDIVHRGNAMTAFITKDGIERVYPKEYEIEIVTGYLVM